MIKKLHQQPERVREIREHPSSMNERFLRTATTLLLHSINKKSFNFKLYYLTIRVIDV